MCEHFNIPYIRIDMSDYYSMRTEATRISDEDLLSLIRHRCSVQFTYNS